MVRVDVTLRGSDARWFLELKEEVAERRRGSEPSNPELVRLMMEQYDPKP